MGRPVRRLGDVTRRALSSTPRNFPDGRARSARLISALAFTNTGDANDNSDDNNADDNNNDDNSAGDNNNDGNRACDNSDTRSFRQGSLFQSAQRPDQVSALLLLVRAVAPSWPRATLPRRERLLFSLDSRFLKSASAICKCGRYARRSRRRFKN